MVGGVTRFDRDEGSAAAGSDVAGGTDRSVDDCFALRGLDHPSFKFQASVGRSWFLKRDFVFGRYTARWNVMSVLFR